MAEPLPPPPPRWSAREADTRQQTSEAVPGLTTPYKTGSAVSTSASPGFSFGTPVRHAPVAPTTRVLFASPSPGATAPPDVSYLPLEWAIPDSMWAAKRSDLVRDGVLIFQAFAVSDKQFQTLLTQLGLPPTIQSLCDVGAARDKAWREFREWAEAIDVWTMLAAMECKCLRVLIKDLDSVTIDGRRLIDRMHNIDITEIRSHSDYSRAVTEFAHHHVEETQCLLVAELASVVFRDRLLRQAFLAAIPNDARDMLRATFPSNECMMLDFIHALLMWKYREEQVWTELQRIDAGLLQHKPASMHAHS